MVRANRVQICIKSDIFVPSCIFLCNHVANTHSSGDIQVISYSKISLAICTYNRSSLLTSMLESIANQTLEPNKFEVLIINNNSSDNTNEAIESFAQSHQDLQIRNIFEPKQGLSHARNTAYRLAQGDYIIYIDDDEIACPNFLESYYNSFHTNPEYTVLGGRILIHPIPNKPKWFGPNLEVWYSIYDNGLDPFEITNDMISSKKTDLPVGGNFAIKVDFLKEIGGFDPNLGRNKDQLLSGEETKVFQEVLKRGHRILYEPSAVVEHVIEPERLTLSHVQEKFYLAGKSSCRLKFETAPKKPLIRFLAGKLVYISSFIANLFSFNYQQRFETWLKLLYECGYTEEYYTNVYSK